MAEETMRKNLYDAATKGEVARFVELVEGDPYLLDVVSFPCSRNLLHIATMWGQAGIVEEVLKINPSLARNLDSEKSSPLHMAAAEGYVEIASKLLAIAPTMCRSRDSQGLNPVHVAAVNGHVEFLEALVPHHLSPAREKVNRGQTVMHLCVKDGQLRALQVLVNSLGELVHVEDDDGETILHLAVRYKQLEIVKYLMDNTEVQEHSTNSKGKTALQISEEQCPEESEITNILKREVLIRRLIREPLRMSNDMVLVVLVMIAGMAFQGAINPPGGVWQDDSPTHDAGTAIMGSNDPESYELFMYYNTSAFTSSMLTILLLAIEKMAPWMVNYELFNAGVFIGMMDSMFYFYVSFIRSAFALIPEREDIVLCYRARPLAIISCIAVVRVWPWSTFVRWFVSAVKIVAVHPRVVVVRNYCDYLVSELTSLFDTWVHPMLRLLGWQRIFEIVIAIIAFYLINFSPMFI